MVSRKDWWPVIWAYVLAVAAAVALLIYCPWPQPWNALAADVLATAVVFGFSLGYRNSSMYDPYWSVIPPLLGIWWLIETPAAAADPRTWLALGLTTLWGVRLTWNWGSHWGGLGHEDWRYPLVRARAGRFGTLADFLGIHLFPTLQVFAGCLPLWLVIAAQPASPLGWLDAAAVIVTFGAIAIETIADLQLHRFLARRSDPQAIINEGLWAWSRHPNYFGELSFWIGLALFGLAAAPQHWLLATAGAAAITAMFVWVSVPLLDTRSMTRRPAYAAHARRVSALLPLPPR